MNGQGPKFILFIDNSPCHTQLNLKMAFVFLLVNSTSTA